MTRIKEHHKPQVGDRAIEVEWCSKLAFDSAGDIDHDRCEYSIRLYRNDTDARLFAEKTWPVTKNTTGTITVKPVEFQAYDNDDAIAYPHVGDWHPIGEAEIFTGDGWERN